MKELKDLDFADKDDQISYWRRGTKIVQDCLDRASRANHEDAPFPLDQEEAHLWHLAQMEAFRHALEMMGVPSDMEGK